MLKAEFKKNLECWAHGVFSGYVIEKIDSHDYEDLVEFYQECLVKHPDHRPLLVIDNTGQAFYLSGHTLGPWDQYLDTADPETYFDSLNSCLQDDLAYVDIKHLHGRIMHFDAEEFELIEIIEDPMFMKAGPIYCFLVPTTDHKLAFLGLPQGGGLSPAETYTYLCLVEEQFSVRFIGLGADFLYFTKELPFTKNEASELVEAIDPFHGGMNQEIKNKFADALVGKTNLIIPHGTR